uniref:Uncharacterized protein n=1 Tax=Aplanochytrium stocchinoi TaxID=215587 RepID=A0A7S3PRL0_9STRA
MNAAGIRNSIFDSVFFGVKQFCTNSLEEGSSSATVNGMIYAFSAATAVVIDYSVDRAVKLKMKTFPDRACPSIRDCILGPFRLNLNDSNVDGKMSRQRFVKGLILTYRGIFFKSLEFSVSYFVTGMCALQIAAAFGNNNYSL